MTTILPAAAGEKLQAEDVNRFSGIFSATAGETINGATTPVAVYMLDADNEWYACDANVQTALDFKGFAITNGTDGNSFVIQTLGVVNGFTGLTAGAKYYVKDDKTLGTTPGTYEIYVGLAISTTEILIDKQTDNGMQYMGSEAISASEASDGSVSDTVTVPAGCRIVVVMATASLYKASGATWGAGNVQVRLNCVLHKYSILTANNVNDIDPGDSLNLSATWDGSTTVTITGSGGSTDAGQTDTLGGTCYFYR